MSRRTLLVSVAAVLAVPDLVQKALAPHYGHARSGAYVVLGALLVAALVVLVPRVPSRALAVAAGIAAAGAVANAVSALAWRGGVPNPIVAGAIAFNLADVYAVVGAAALVMLAAAHALLHPADLRRPI